MLAIQCPSCQHRNTPGESFCAFCGVPLNLKPCPNCGKVDLVTTKTCSGCGAVFPPISLAQGNEVSQEQAPSEDAEGEIDLPSRRRPIYANTVPAPQPASEVPPSRAFPLILVAIVAGGIPLLWMNRDRMPLPKAWRVQSGQTESAPNTQPPSQLSPSATPSQPHQAAPAPPHTVPSQSPQEQAKGSGVKPETAETRPVQPLPQAAPPAQGSRLRDNAKTGADRHEQPVQPKECTEAVAALGLCDAKQIKK